MSSIEKVKILDSRIVQPQPRYAVNEGAQEVSNVPFAANNSSASSLTFNINVPSNNVFIDRTMTMTATVLMAVDVNIDASADGATFPVSAADSWEQILKFGSNCALPAFPLQSLMNTLSVTINNATITTNMKDTLYELLRLTNMKKNHLQRTTPTMLDKYADYNQSNELDNNPIHGFGKALESDNVPNGAYSNVEFCDANGNPVTEETYAYPKAAPASKKLNKTIYYKYTVTEKLVISPFIFSEECDDEVGLYSINNIQIIANIGDASRNLRIWNNSQVVSFSNVRLASQNPFTKPMVNAVFRTPSLSIPLPEQSIVPFLETPRYISANNNLTIAPGATQQLQMSGITLTQIPDMLLIYVKPQQMAQNYGDFYLPIEDISMMFDNRSGLLSSMTREQLFDISVKNGLNMDYNQFLGSAYVDNSFEKVPLVGGFLVLRPGVDFSLTSGSASGLGGNYNLQFNLKVRNQLNIPIVNPSLYCVAVNSGFFISSGGSSRYSTAPLTEADIIQAPVAGSSQELSRMVGGSWWNKIGSSIKNFFTHPTVKNVGKEVYKTLSKEGKKLARNSGDSRLAMAANVADMVGLGSQTGGRSTGGKKKGLKSLMY